MRVVKKPEERKAEMVAAAAKLFAEQGFVRTSVAEIVSAVDVAKGLFYYYFTTKDDMVKAVVEGYCSYLGSVADSIAAGEGTAAGKIDALLGHDAWNECFTAPLVRDLCLPQHAALYTDMCDRVSAHMGPALERIVAQALREQGRDESDAHTLVSVMLYGVLMTARKGELTMETVGELVSRMIGARREAA